MRRQVLARDGGRCQWMEGPRLCGAPATDVDHIKASGSDELWNLRSLCGPHHAVKSSSEGGQASWAALNARKKAAKRPPLEHPVPAEPIDKPRFSGF